MQFSDLDINETYTYADYLKWTFEDRLELIKGKIFKMTPAPNSAHQRQSGNIYVELHKYLKNKPCEVFAAPFDVRLPRVSVNDEEIINVVQPDICVICDPAKIDYKGCIGVPDIIVEYFLPVMIKRNLKTNTSFMKKPVY